MNKNKLKAILNCISTAEDSISLLACDNFPYGAFEDKELKDMFYQLNDMCLLLRKKIEQEK